MNELKRRRNVFERGPNGVTGLNRRVNLMVYSENSPHQEGKSNGVR